MKLGHVSLDSTKLKANASKRRAMSCGRMEKRSADPGKEVDRLLVQAGKTDNKEDAAYGKGKRGDELPEDLRFKEKTGMGLCGEARAFLPQRSHFQAAPQGSTG